MNKAKVTDRQIGWKESDEGVKEKVVTTVSFIVAVALFCMTALVTLATPVLADNDSGWGTMAMGEAGWIVLVIIGAFSLIVGLATKDSMSAKKRSIAVIIGALLLMVAMVPVLIESVPDDDDDKPLPPSPTWKFDVVPSVDVTNGASYPAGTFTDCDTIFVADNTPEWQSAQGLRDLSDPKVPKMTALYTIDTTLSRANVDFSDPNCILIQHSVDLTNGVDNDGDGTNDAVSYTGRVISVGKSSTRASNDSGTYDVIHQDSELRWYIGFQDDGSDWVEAYEHSEDFPGGSSASFIIGNHNGGSADTVHFFVLTTDYGIWNYDTVTNDEIEIVYEIAGQRIRLVLNADSVS